MELLIKSNDELRRYIANVVHEVDDEALLYDKMLPSLEESHEWLAQNIVSEVSILDDQENKLAKQLVVKRAFFYAVPSLDIVLTPNGFGVVNSTNIAPASKERVERLRATLKEECDSLAVDLIEHLRANPLWVDSDDSAQFRSTLLTFGDVEWLRKPSESRLVAFRRLLPLALTAESELESRYLGKTLMDKFRSATFNKSAWPSLEAGCGKELSNDLGPYLAFAQRQKNFSCPEPHVVWHCFMRSIRYCLRIPEFKSVWESEVGNLFEVKMEDVRPSKQGGGWL